MLQIHPHSDPEENKTTQMHECPKFRPQSKSKTQKIRVVLDLQRQTILIYHNDYWGCVNICLSLSLSYLNISINLNLYADVTYLSPRILCEKAMMPWKRAGMCKNAHSYGKHNDQDTKAKT